ncbi:hypothetical protein HMH01_17010 [Halovulum dunhuangense]|uniref:Uncharacterized protein n=1 Tax=Halovulum dunhuangense TaxID=1505036 RepID=A0A849L6S6_9RHOB|nr:hypothetical protein [Halovulum dunhuangense]NNU82139.1 hypothetical protein [Halovulum dunhuangense]
MALSFKLIGTDEDKRISIPLEFSPGKSDPAVDLCKPEPLEYFFAQVAPSAPDSELQTRFLGRKIIEPSIDLDSFRFESVIDWVWILIEVKHTSSKWISEKLSTALGRNPRVISDEVKPWDDAVLVDFVGNRFGVVIQEPTPLTLIAVNKILSREFGMVKPAKIAGIELALDLYPRDASDQLRWAMTAVLHRHHLPPKPQKPVPRSDYRHTFSSKKGIGAKPQTKFVIAKRGAASDGLEISDYDLAKKDARMRVLGDNSHFAPFIDSTVYRGERGDPVMFRIQNKVEDSRVNGVGIRLAPEHRRARIEVTLSGPACAKGGLKKLQDLFGYNFGTLGRGYFDFWLPSIVATSADKADMAGIIDAHRERRMIEIFVESGVYGLDLYEEALKRQHSRNTSGAKKVLAEQSNDAEQSAGTAPMRWHRSSRNRKAWDEMRAKTYEALRRLTKTWRSPS